MRGVIAVVGVRVATLAFAATVLAQGQPADPQFDAVSIKPVAPGERLTVMRKFTPDRIVTAQESVESLLRLAYPEIARDDVTNLPRWARDERFAIHATLASPATSVSKKMRSLLEQYFQFRSHVEHRETEVYDLVLARADRRIGTGLIPAPSQCEKLRNGTSADDSACIVEMKWSPSTMEAKMTMTGLASLLRPVVGRPVMDKTGLSGAFKVTLKAAGVSAAFVQSSGPDRDDIPSVFTALPDQLGLRLVPSRGTLDVLVIDHIERPTEN